MSQMLEEIAQLVDLKGEDAWIYLQDIPTAQISSLGVFCQRWAMKLSRKRKCLRESAPTYTNNRNKRSVPAPPVLSVELLLTSCTANYFLALYGFDNA